MTRSVRLLLSAGTLIALVPGRGLADEAEKPSFVADVAPFLTRHCTGCHGGKKPKGRLALDVKLASTDDAGVAADKALWEKVADALRTGDMPPPDKPRPGNAELNAVNRWLDAAVFRVDCRVAPNPGRVVLRRLNRAEYNNTIRDLFGLPLHPADAFPSDDVGYGFDNVGDVLSVSPLLTEKYLAAADKIVAEVWRHDDIRKRIVFLPLDQSEKVASVRQVLRAFAERAWRRPVTEDEMKRLVHLVDIAERSGDKPEVGIQLALRAVLASPNFIFRAEYDPPPPSKDKKKAADDKKKPADKGKAAEDKKQTAEKEKAANDKKPTPEKEKTADDKSQAAQKEKSARDTVADKRDKPYEINDWELASRLSYFLWSSMPDDNLFRAARSRKLHESAALDGQVRRMLKDEKARALVDNFALQWLQLRNLKSFAPDPVRFPTFDESLRNSMQRETELTFEYIVKEDRSVLELLSADYTFLDERLAKHYGIAGVSGDDFRRVMLTDSPRGGLLTQASVLAVTSNPTRTSPVKRGKWVLENLLGTPPPPPPGNVDLLKDDKPGAELTGTLRQRMEQHRANPNCANCHQSMDPLGFGLENFDAIGAWRTLDGKEPVDAAGVLPGGQSFNGPAQLKTVLLGRKEQFARCLTEKVLTYALGRGIERSDHCAVDAIANELAAGEYRFSALVLSVVHSEPFRKRLPQGMVKK
jgi:mono/diheme cytochrome c family protein